MAIKTETESGKVNFSNQVWKLLNGAIDEAVGAGAYASKFRVLNAALWLFFHVSQTDRDEAVKAVRSGEHVLDDPDEAVAEIVAAVLARADQQEQKGKSRRTR